MVLRPELAAAMGPERFPREADAAAWTGSVDRTIEYLQRAIAARDFYYAFLFARSFDLIRSDPRYEAILHTMGLSQR